MTDNNNGVKPLDLLFVPSKKRIYEHQLYQNDNCLILQTTDLEDLILHRRAMTSVIADHSKQPYLPDERRRPITKRQTPDTVVSIPFM